MEHVFAAGLCLLQKPADVTADSQTKDRLQPRHATTRSHPLRLGERGREAPLAAIIMLTGIYFFFFL